MPRSSLITVSLNQSGAKNRNKRLRIGMSKKTMIECRWAIGEKLIMGIDRSKGKLYIKHDEKGYKLTCATRGNKNCNRFYVCCEIKQEDIEFIFVGDTTYYTTKGETSYDLLSFRVGRGPIKI